MSEDLTKEIRRASIAMLARRDYSRHDLIRKLTTKGYLISDIEPILIYLTQKGFLNEPRYVELFIYSKRNKGYGPERIARELQLKGISDEMIAEQLQITDNAWLDEARKIWQKKFKNTLPTNFNDRAKQMRFLQYRGFTREQIEQTIPSR